MKKILPAVLAAIIILALAACGTGIENKVYEPSDLEGKNVGVLANTASAGYALRFRGIFNVKYYDSLDAMAADLKNGVIDCAIADEGRADDMCGAASGLRTLDEPYVDTDYAVAVSVDNRLMLENLDSAVEELRRGGELGRIVSGWNRGSYDGGYEIDESAPVVTVGVQPDFYPYAFYNEEGELAGIDIDVATAICEYLGLRPEFAPVESGKLLYVAESGKTSFTVGRITPDPSNGALSFTTAYMHSRQLIVVRK